MKNVNSALAQANAQMESIRALVAAVEVDYDRLEELREESLELRQMCIQIGASKSAHDALTIFEVENGDELRQLEEATGYGECESQDDAIERIRDDALSVEVRSDWYTVGGTSEPSEFRIVLCTGGPHVQIVGELFRGEPSSARLEYSDWGTGMTERVNQEGDQEALLTYASQFYFGE